jgi:hypothetical protein
MTLTDLASRQVAESRRSGLKLALLAAFFGLYATANARTYFIDIQQDPLQVSANHANFDNGLRAIFRENAKSPVYAISTRKGNVDAWQIPDVLNELEEHLDVLYPIPYKVAAAKTEYFEQEGLFGLLRQQPKNDDGSPSADPVVLLTPFHFYLEPFLVKELGGERVAEVPLAINKDGVDKTDVGMAYDPHTATRLIRLKGFTPAKLDSLGQRWLLPFHLQELSPPPALATRESVKQVFVHEPKGVALMEDYAKDPGRWHQGSSLMSALLPGRQRPGSLA